MKDFVKALSVVLLLAGGSLSAQTNVIPDAVELAALKDIYDSLGGSGWTTKTNWPTPGNWPATATAAQMGTWFGITVTNGDVSTIFLAVNNLVGKIPSSVGNLTALTGLAMYHNTITGKIPSSIGNLTKMVNIRLYENQLSGAVPSSIGNLTQMTMLNLVTNKLTSLPAEINNLTNLTYLNVISNALTSLPYMGNLQQLTSLMLSGDGTPTSNTFNTTIPSWIYGLTNLQGLYLSGAHFSGTISPSIGSLTQLIWIDFHQNQLTGPIPSSIGSLVNLAHLDLSINQLSGAIPKEIGNLTNLTILNLSSNQLTSSIPSEVGGLTKLTALQLNSNQLNGSIPASIGNLTSLINLYLDHNQLTGLIPSTIGNLTNLTLLNIFSNQLTGSIPLEIGELTKLTTLQLQGNQLTGSIPSTIGNLVNMGFLTLNSNKFTGSIPSSIGNLTKLGYLYLDNNILSGNVPDVFANLTSLLDFRTSGNKLTGTLPPSIGSCTHLTNFSFTNNQFTGAIPSTYANLTKIVFFYVDQNKLSGALPSFIGNWTSLFSLVITNNNFTGSIPASINSCTALGSLGIGNNNFSGAFPSIQNLTKFVSMDASNNKFTSLPNDILNLPLLTSLNFTNNELSTIPNFANHVNKANLTLTLTNNRLDFSMLEPITGAGIKTATMVPQKTLNDVPIQVLTTGTAFILTARTKGANTSNLKWEKQQSNNTWQDISSSNADALTGNTYRIASATVASEGKYRWSATSTKTTGFTLQSDPIVVKSSPRFTLDNFGFQYKYDARKRMIAKKVPGADWVYMVYDSRDRLVLTQDGNQRLSNQWTFTKYDALNRPIVSGIYTHTAFLDQAGMSALISTTNFYEAFNADPNNYGYTNTVLVAPNFSASGFEPLTVTFYDNYQFLNNADSFSYKPDELGNQYQAPSGSAFTQVTGMITGTYVKNLGKDRQWLRRVNYYDDKYRVVQTVSDNFIEGIERATNVYDFTGKVLQSKTTISDQSITWQGVTNAKASKDRITKTVSSSTWGNSGATSVQVIPTNANGWVEFSCSAYAQASAMIAFGLSDSNTDNNYTSIDYCIYHVRDLGSSTITVYENGTAKTTALNTMDGDMIRVERIGTTVYYKRNGQTFYQSTVPSTTQLIGDLALNIWGDLYNPRISVSNSSNTITRTFDYDHAGRLLKTWHSINSATPVLLAKNEYNEIGQLVDKKLYSTDPISTPDDQRHFKQSTDYRYNIRGWLTSINDSQLTVSDPNSNRDLFGMNLSYNDVVSGLSNQQMFNGNISAIRWSNNLALGNTKDVAYKYCYDTLNRIKSAAYLTNPGVWTASSNFAENGFSYDLNGNIKKLTRTDASGGTMDALTYDYTGSGTRGNQLKSVTDAGDLLKGFTDGNVSGDDYSYDANGNMISDKNKNITAITYNYLNLPQQVTKGTGEKVIYTYDAGGRKLSQQVFNASSVQQKKCDYVGEFYYENDTLNFINHEEGRIVMKTATPEYQYHHKDHLGNVRVTFTTQTTIDTPVATFETANQNVEQSQFLRYDDARIINSQLFDHTHNGSTNAYSERLSGSANEKTGIARSISVMPGDTIKMEVYAKYVDASNSNNDVSLTNLLAQIVAGTASAGTVIDGANYSTNGITPFPFTDLAGENGSTGTGPKAYLNYIMFDRNHIPIIDDHTQTFYVQVSTAAKEDGKIFPYGNPHERLYAQVVAKQAGYMYIYLSNEETSPKEVYFDDFKVTQVKSPVVQQEDFYAGGATFNSYFRENSVANKYLYQEKEWLDDFDLNEYDFGPRRYDPYRLTTDTQDPHAESYYGVSPYSWASGNPINFIDPSGMDVINAIDRVILDGDHATIVFEAIQAMAQQHDQGGGGDDDKKKKDDKKASDKKDDKKDAAVPLILVLTKTAETAAVETPALPFAIAGAVGWKAGEAIGENVDPIAEGIATVLEWFGVASEDLRGPNQVDAQHGKNNGKLDQEQLDILRQKAKDGTISNLEKQKLKRHDKNTGDRPSRQSKDKK